MNTRDLNDSKKKKARQERATPHPQWNDRLIALARGELSGAALAKTQAHLKGCTACQAAYRDYQDIFAIIGEEPDAALLAELSQLDMPPGLTPRMSKLMDDYVAGVPIPELEKAPPTTAEAEDAPSGEERVLPEKDRLPRAPEPQRVLAPPLPSVPSRINSGLDEYRVMSFEGTVGPFQRYMGVPKLHPTPVEIRVLATRLSPEDLEQFRREARALRRLDHPNIVPLIDYGVERENPYLVLGYTPTVSLREKHQDDLPLPPATVVAYIQQVAEALTYAHKQNIIHRNITPDNLLLGSGNRVWVTNFGTSVGILPTAAESAEEAALPFYTAPEQLHGLVGKTTDQYALAAVAYEWLTGSPPFSGASFAEVAERQQQSKPIPPRRKQPALPVEVDHVLLKALSKQPHQRFPDVQAFALALARAVSNTPIASVAETTQDYAVPETPPKPKQDQPGAESMVYEGHSGPVLAVAWSKSGQRIASGGVDGTVQVWETQQGQEVARYSGHKEHITALSWAHARNLLASADTDGDVHIWEPESGENAGIYTRYPKALQTVAWSPNNDLLACGGEDHTVHVWKAGERQPFIIYKGHTQPLSSLVWSPDGKRIASADIGGAVHVWEIDSGTHEPMTVYTEHGKSVSALAWSPNGSRIASGGEDTHIDIWNAGSGDAIFSYSGHQSTVSALDWSPDGNYMASGDHEGAIHVWAARTGRRFLTLPSAHTDRITRLAWSPAQSNFLASSSLDGTATRWEIVPQQA